MVWFEKGPGFAEGLKSLKRDFNASAVTSGIIAAIFGLAALVVHIGAGQEAGMTSDQITMWAMNLTLLGGIGCLIIPLYYKLPFAIANSIPGAILFASLIPVFGWQELLGAAIVAGIIIFLLGITGSIGKVMEFLPVPIVLGMTGGCLLKFGLEMVSSIPGAPVGALLMILAYLLTTCFIKNFPGVLAAVVVGVIVMAVQGVDTSSVVFRLDYPHMVMPKFSWGAIVSLSVPLAILVIGAENAQALGVLKAQKYKPPINGMTILSGLGGIVSPFFGVHNTNIAGPMTAMSASEDSGEKSKRWIAPIVIGIVWVVSAPFCGTIVEFFTAVPAYFMDVVVGLALVKVLVSCIGDSLGSPTHKLGALFAFLIGASGISAFNLSAPFWGLVGGLVVSLLLEYDQFEFVRRKKQSVQADQAESVQA